ncbi:SMC-Scp complex subunit ScpB [Chitinophaga polysaccharea]|uniref:SMC-Scp complex subunit ScpB n=1 Tax=Chitinophaga polysaccharea TaxID=1293035 RepID=UPI0011593403|nr:SMC-Scp complex subunit ScpB [Chitinophaga polysaccharea]
MEISQIIPHVEALIFAADRPLPLLEIVDLLNNALAFLEDRTNLDQVEAAMEAIREKYSSEFYAFEVRSSGGGYQFLTKKDYYQTVAQLNGDKFLKRLSTAALETLAIIAYRQPISKGEIEYIRGVSTDYSIQKLLEKELIVITGRSEDQPGKPLLYAVSRSFMDYFGISSVADLPKLKELFDEEMVQPTLINDDTATLGRGEHGTHTAETAHSLMVSEDGELLDPDRQLEQLTSPDAEEEPPASEDEEVEPDDEIVRFDDIIEEVNEELGEESETSLAETDEADEDSEDEDPYAVKDTASRANDEESEDPDGIIEDIISGKEEKEIEEAAEQEEEEEEQEEKEQEEEEDGDEEPESTMEDAILGEKLLEISGPGIEYDDEEEEEEDDEDEDDDDYDDEDDEEDEEDDDDENSKNSGK